MNIEAIGVLFQFVGGLGMFLYGMNQMADGLQKSAGHRMQKLLGVLTSNRLMGVLLGAGITAIIQSSSATTIMVVGFVNAGLMDLTQAVGVIMGANIGTTVTSWIVSMSEWGKMLKPEFFAPVLVGIGAGIILFAKDSRKKEAGEILTGFGFLFIGLSFMSSSIEPYRDAPVFGNIFSVLGKNPLLGILAGAVVTAIIQSSSASVGILQTLALNGVVNWQSAIFITLGQNIGTCITAILSSVGAHRTAKRAAAIHLLFNVMGAVIFGIIMGAVFFMNPDLAGAQISSVEISIFHTIFNVGNTILLFPFAGALVKVSGMMLGKKKPSSGAVSLDDQMSRHLDTRLLETPSLAIEQVQSEIISMGEAAINNLKLAGQALVAGKEENIREVFENEAIIDRMQKLLAGYLVEISNQSLNEEQHLVVKNLFYTINDIERIGDHCENLAELAEEKKKNEIFFSEEASQEMESLVGIVVDAVSCAVGARKNQDMTLVRQALRREEEVDSLEEDLRENHMKRLAEMQCNFENGVVFLDAVSNLERISDHAVNIAGYVKEEASWIGYMS